MNRTINNYFDDSSDTPIIDGDGMGANNQQCATKGDKSMNELTVIQNDQFGEVRIIQDENNDPWFCGKDVLAALDYSETSNPAKVFQMVPEIWKGVKRFHTRSENGTEQERELLCISEQGLYFFLGRSDKPKSTPYQMFIAGEVMPSIRKHGMYATQEVVERLLANPDFAISLFQELKTQQDKNAALMTANAIQAQQLAEAQPKVTYYDTVLKSKSLVKTGVIASDYGMSAQKLNKILADLKVQHKQGNIWLLHDKYQHEGYTQTETYAYEDKKTGETKTNCWMKWTQKGRLFLYDLLKANGYLPVCEQAA